MLPTIVVAAVVVALLVVALIVVRSKNKGAEAEAPRFEPPRELAPQKPKEPAASTAPPVAVSTAPTPPATSQPPASGQFPAPAPAQEQTAALGAPPVAAPPPPAPTPLPVAAEPPKPPPPAEEPKQEQTEALVSPPIKTPPPTPAPTPKPSAPPVPGAPAKPRAPLRSYSSINDLDGDDKADAKPASPKPTAPPMPARTSEAKVAAAPPKPVAPVAPPPPKSEPKVEAKPEPKVATGKMPPAKPEEHDFSALAEAKPEPKPEPKPEAKVEAKPEPKPEPAKPTGAAAAAAIAAKYMQPSNPATAELEKNDPRHAAARKFARLSVSEIKLYHEDEVKAGRENKDLWTRLQTDIGLARQTFEQRVVAEVRERFDYLLDEIIRQLAEGDASKLGPDAPQLKTESGGTAGVPAAAEPKAASAAPSTPKPVPEAPKSEPKAEPKPAPAAAAAAPVARAGAPANPETAELEKSDPRHAAARRLARLSVSEIKLYHEAEVTAGRENKDLWSRLTADIALATTTFEKRVDKEVRDRFDYLYDEILRQLAEGDVAKLGPGAPTPKKVEAPAPAPTPTPAPAAAAPAPTPAAPAAATGAAAGIAAKYMQPGNPATAELEKSDPRHAAARRFARLSVSEIKLYHEDEVKAGREAKDLWTRMSTDIGLAMQTYEKRVDKEVRDRFDYLYDEILRQLAEGDAAKLGPGAPAPKP